MKIKRKIWNGELSNTIKYGQLNEYGNTEYVYKYNTKIIKKAIV